MLSGPDKKSQCLTGSDGVCARGASLVGVRDVSGSDGVRALSVVVCRGLTGCVGVCAGRALLKWCVSPRHSMSTRSTGNLARAPTLGEMWYMWPRARISLRRRTT